jgi:hypothetical protein
MIQAQWEIIEMLAEKARKEMIEVEDERTMNDLEEAPLHKAFDREYYLTQVKGLKKEELLESLINEAHIRYNMQCELADARFDLGRFKTKLRQIRAELDKWKLVARNFHKSVQLLMG